MCFLKFIWIQRYSRRSFTRPWNPLQVYPILLVSIHFQFLYKSCTSSSRLWPCLMQSRQAVPRSMVWYPGTRSYAGFVCWRILKPMARSQNQLLNMKRLSECIHTELAGLLSSAAQSFPKTLYLQHPHKAQSVLTAYAIVKGRSFSQFCREGNILIIETLEPEEVGNTYERIKFPPLWLQLYFDQIEPKSKH